MQKNGFLASFLAGAVRDLCSHKGSPTPLNAFKGGRGRTHCVSPPLRPPLKIPPESPPPRIIPFARRPQNVSEASHLVR